MNDELAIRFQAPERPGAARTVVPFGGMGFVLYASGDAYTLPEVVFEQQGTAAYLTVLMPPRIVVHRPEGRADGSVLEQALRTAWGPSKNERLGVVGRTVLAAQQDVGTGLVHRPAGIAPGRLPFPQRPAATAERVELDVSWFVEYEGGPVGQRTAQGSVHLVFAAPDEVPTDSQQPDEEVFLTLRPPLDGPDYQRFVVVDFGTTASTATLHDGAVVPNEAVDPAQSRALGEMLAELTAPPPDAPGVWKRELERLRGESVVLAREGSPAIGWETALERLAEADVADAVMLEVEHSCRDGGRALRDWLVPRLHTGYARVVNTPALGRHSLVPVRYPDVGRERTYAPASAIVETSDTEYRRGVSAHVDHGFRLHADKTGGLVGIKRALFQHRPRPVPGSERPAVHLAQHMYHLLLDQAEWSTTERVDGLPSRVRTAVLTYPTTILPEAKARLERLVREGLSIPDVVMDFDEGLAAGLYFVMRDLSGNQNLGLEALRAGSRQVGEDPPTWQRIMLVIDIGGGTTDVALLGLTLTDTTVELGPDQAFVSGRDYRLEPRLLGSTGHGQLGGDLLTLQVFYWLKARLVDFLGAGETVLPPVDGSPQRRARPLAEQVAEQAAITLPQVVSDEVREILRQRLPTHFEPGATDPESAARKRRFEELWRLAEAKKREFGRGGDGEVALSVSEIDLALKEGGLGRNRPLQALPLDRDQFRRLTAPVLHQAAEIGAHLVRTTFERLRRQRDTADRDGRPVPAEPVLDQVVLSGRTSALPEVRSAVTTQLTKQGQESIDWNPAALSVETGYVAKQATSIGAAWAHTTRNRSNVVSTVRSAAGPGADGALGETAHAAGIQLSNLQIHTDGLFSSLPCKFEIGLQAGQFLPLFEAGEPFAELDASGRAGVRSAGWSPLPRELVVYRPVAELTRIQWGSFALRQAAIREGFTLAGPVWDLDRGALAAYRIEVDDRLQPRILLCNGAPHLLVTGARLDLNGAVSGLEFKEPLGYGAVPGRICVAVGDPAEATPTLAEVFSALSALPPVPSYPPGSGREEGGSRAGSGNRVGGAPGGSPDLLRYFPESFHDGDDAQQRPVPGRVARLRAAPQHGYFHFYLDRGAGTSEYLGRLEAPAQARYGLEDNYQATLDARGRLRVHRGEIPYLAADSLEQVQERPGRVLTQRMDEGIIEFNEFWDPFNGRH
ncbi:hypothetical protein [Streptacidiphilus cavernicola]|uniref:Molecular chaperone DnaK n=1 Tax=Streptacidiphilus cavernicola TaxID=3342716 RepID=A0ABV6VSB0_9ACTN